MESHKITSFSGQMQALVEADKDFAQKLKQRLVSESSKVVKPFNLIVNLFKKGVLSDEPSDLEPYFGFKEMIVQLNITIACSKGAGGIGGLIEALEESGNYQLISAVRTWAEDFVLEIDRELSEPQGASAVQCRGIKNLSNNETSPTETSSSGAKLIDKIRSRLEDYFIEHLEGQLIDSASKIVHAREFCKSLVHQIVLPETDIPIPSTEPEPGVQEVKLTKTFIKAACSKKAIGSLVLALQSSNNERILAETCGWLETSQGTQKNYPIAVKSLANQRRKEESKALIGAAFFKKTALPDELSKLATFNFQQRPGASNGAIGVQFDKNRMMACAADGTLNLWKWQVSVEEPVNVATEVKNITCFQYDEEILVLGTAEGTVNLFDAKTLEEISRVEIGEPVTSLEFVESTLVILTRSVLCQEQVWWMDISRPKMRLRGENPRSVGNWGCLRNRILGACMDSYITLVYRHKWAGVYDTKSGDKKIDHKKRPCYLWAPAYINNLHVGDLLTPKRIVVAGCTDGMIVIWITSKFICNQRPVKIFRGHTEAIVSLCHLNGKLLSLDQSGKLFMWPGRDLVEENVTPIPRELVENSNMTCLFAHERWFASLSSKDDVINIWTLPDLWFRTA